MDDVERIRRFNRLVTQRVGALEDSYLARGRPLGEARLLSEIGRGETDLQALRQRLGLDSGYASRLLRSLEGQGLLRVEAKAEDNRARTIALTDAGREEYAAYERLSDRLAESLTGSLDAMRRNRLIAAMGEVELLLRAATLTVDLEPAASDEAQWCLGEYFSELQRRFETGFDPNAGKRFDAADMTPPKGWFVLARIDGEPVGCGALVGLGDRLGEIKRVWSSPSLRGAGAATRIMDQLEQLAREAGYRRLRLDTNGALTEAQAMYRKRGYHEIARYNDNPYAQHWFEKDLGETG